MGARPYRESTASTSLSESDQHDVRRRKARAFAAYQARRTRSTSPRPTPRATPDEPIPSLEAPSFEPEPIYTSLP